MTDQEYTDLKKSYIELITKMITQSGGLSPVITLLGAEKDAEHNALVNIIIPNSFLKDEDTKEAFIQKALPEIASDLKKRFTVSAVGWASEAWLRVADADMDPEKLNNGEWKKLPIKKEVVIITIDSKDKNDSLVYEIMRHGKQINTDGKLIDNIELKELSEFGTQNAQAEGRFTNLYRKFFS